MIGFSAEALCGAAIVSFGNLEFGPNSTYRFIDSGTSLEDRAAQTNNFFMLHPSGTVEVHYVGSTTPDTRLESVGEGATVAHLVFTSDDHRHAATFFVKNMDTGWQNYW